MRVNTSLLTMTIVDAWLLYKQSCGANFCMKPWSFYNELDTGLLENRYDRTCLRSFEVEKAITNSHMAVGTGIHLSLTGRKRKRNDRSSTNISYQGRCCACGGNDSAKKSPFYCSEYFSLSGKDVYICNVDTGRQCFAHHLSSKHAREVADDI